MWLVRLVHMLTNCQKQLVKRYLMTAGKVRGTKTSSKYSMNLTALNPI